MATETKKPLWGLMRRRECLVPTWRGWLALVLALLALALLTVPRLHSFLAVNAPLPGGVLVVEGWAPDYAMQTAAAEFRNQHYDRLYVTGGPLEWGSFLSEYKTYAERGEKVLLALGLTTNQVQAVPAPSVRQDRTYTSAITLKNWCQAHQAAPARIHLLTIGPHARRSRLLFQRAFGKGTEIGVSAIPDPDYDQQHWWRSSAGVRSVIAEALAYAYAKVLFRATP